jgi:hypothetical protein
MCLFACTINILTSTTLLLINNLNYSLFLHKLSQLLTLLSSSAQAYEIDLKDLQNIYRWIDAVPLSRPKRNFARDFADGVLASEVIKHFQPKLVDLHNYSKSNSQDTKKYNWNTLNTKVLKKLGYSVSKGDIESVRSRSNRSVATLKISQS